MTNNYNIDNKYLNTKKLKKILDNSFSEIFVYDDNYKVIYVNEACKRHYGLKPSDIIGKTIWDFKKLGYWQPLALPIVYKQKKRITLEQEIYLGKKIIMTATPVLDENNNIELVVMNIHDPLNELDIIQKSIKDNTESILEPLAVDGINFITRNKEMKNAIELAKRTANVKTTVLIQGESGTGKGLLAKYINNIYNKKENSMLTINCAAIPEDLLEAELFGYKAGAFTGAQVNKKGLLELANDGIVFLDEISELPLKLQAKLLRVIEEQKYIPVGGEKEKRVNVKIIAATNSNLEEMVKNNSFRKDLYYRLNVINIKIPPLRKRPEDILILTHHFLYYFNNKYNSSHQITKECLDLFEYYNWPGNVRELKNIVERLVITVTKSVIDINHLPDKFKTRNQINKKLPTSLDLVKEEVEKKLITRAYKKHGSSRKVAEALNVSQSRAYRLIKKYVYENK